MTTRLFADPVSDKLTCFRPILFVVRGITLPGTDHLGDHLLQLRHLGQQGTEGFGAGSGERGCRAHRGVQTADGVKNRSAKRPCKGCAESVAVVLDRLHVLEIERQSIRVLRDHDRGLRERHGKAYLPHDVRRGSGQVGHAQRS